MNNTSKPVQRWTKPELVKLGALKDVSGAAAINANGSSSNPRDPAAS